MNQDYDRIDQMMIVFNLEPVFFGFYVGLVVAVGILLYWIARARFFQGKFNNLIVVGLSLLFGATLLLFFNPFEVVITSSLVTLQIADLEQILLWTGCIIALVGGFRANKWPKKGMAGMALLLAPVFLSMEIESRLGLTFPASSPSEFNTITLIVGSVILAGGLLVALAGQEMKNARAHVHNQTN